MPYNNSDKDDERKKKQKQQLEWQMEHLRLEWKEKELRCQNVREQCGDVKKSDAGKRLREQREALVMAEEILVRTAKETSDVISHKINARASEIFSEITDGKYRSVNIQKRRGNFGMERYGSHICGPVERRNVGTDLFFNKNGSVGNAFGRTDAGYLDDAFAFYDDKRLESVIKWLSRQKKQVIILSCHSREAKLLEHLV